MNGPQRTACLAKGYTNNQLTDFPGFVIGLLLHLSGKNSQLDRYMSKITQKQNLGVSRWHNPKLATIGPESCLEGVPYSPFPSHQSTIYTLPCPMVASFGLRNRDIQDFSACVMSDADGWTDRHTAIDIVRMSYCAATDFPPLTVSEELGRKQRKLQMGKRHYGNSS